MSPTAQIPPISDAPRPPLVAVLLCTYNGADFLDSQLESIAHQTHDGWKIWASDDGSTDGTLDLLARYAAPWGAARLAVLTGPRKGFVANFMSLVCNPEITAAYYAYADQDDVWEADKLARAVAWLETVPQDRPALYMSRTRLIDEEGRDLGLARMFTAKAPTFANAMVQSIGGGNTMVFNAAARTLLMAYSKDVAIVSHDWWTYMLVTGAGGIAFYDPYPSLGYRQHRRQLVGTNASWLARLWRALLVLGGRFKRWSAINVEGLQAFRPRLTPENRRIFDEFCAARTGSLPKRLLSLRRSGVHRQDFVDNIGLYVAVLFNRL